MHQRSRRNPQRVFSSHGFRPMKSSVDINQLYDGIGTDTRDEKVEQIIMAQNHAQRKMSQLMEERYLTEAYKLANLKQDVSYGREQTRKSYTNYLSYMNDATTFDQKRQLDQPDLPQKEQAVPEPPAQDRFGADITVGQDIEGNVREPEGGRNYYGDRQEDGFDYYGNPLDTDASVDQYGNAFPYTPPEPPSPGEVGSDVRDIIRNIGRHFSN